MAAIGKVLRRDSSSPVEDKALKPIFIVCHVLPVKFIKLSSSSISYRVEWDYNNLGILLKFTKGNVSTDDHVKYIGCPSIYVEKHRRSEIETLLAPLNCIPVFLEAKTAHEHYQGFTQGVLWPLFHNIVDVYSAAKIHSFEAQITDRTVAGGAGAAAAAAAAGTPTAATNGTLPHSLSENNVSAQWQQPESWNPVSQADCWGSYCIVNRIFASKVVESYHENAIVWIHNIQLMMLPSYLIRKIPRANIAFLFHMPFPSSEIFRCLAMREEILRALLCANHIGFLLFEYARHFLTSCKRLLGLSYESRQGGSLGVEYNGRHVMITCSHMSTEVELIERSLIQVRQPQQQQQQQRQQPPQQDSHDRDASDLLRQLKAEIPTDAIVFIGVDSMQGLSGLPFKLLAFDRFLSLQHEKKREAVNETVQDVVLVQVCSNLQYRPNDFSQTLQQVSYMVDAINKKYPYPMVVLKRIDTILSLQDRLTLWDFADHFMSSSVRWGFSSFPFEFVITKQHKSSPGVVITSEFSSYSRVLNGALVFNPWKTADVVDALINVMSMSADERASRSAMDMAFIRHHAISHWSDRMLHDIDESTKTDERMTYMGVGFGFGYRVMSFGSEFMKLNEHHVVSRYTNAARRLLILNDRGTLSHIQNSMAFELAKDQLVHDEEVKESLRALTRHPNNVVYIISSASRDAMEDAFGSTPRLGLISDSGYFYRAPERSEWEALTDPSTLLTWKSVTRAIMETYADRTNGALVSETEVSLVYDYRRSDPEYGELQANELLDHLGNVLHDVEVEIVRGVRSVEVLPTGVNKGTAMHLLLRHCKTHDMMPEFIFYAGADATDECAFKALKQYRTASVVTCTVGKKPSEASFFVDSIQEIQALILTLGIKLYNTDHNHGHSHHHHQQHHHQHTQDTATSSADSFQKKFHQSGPTVSEAYVKTITQDFGRKQGGTHSLKPPASSSSKSGPNTSAASSASGAAAAAVASTSPSSPSALPSSSSSSSCTSTSFCSSWSVTLGLFTAGVYLGWKWRKYYGGR